MCVCVCLHLICFEVRAQNLQSFMISFGRNFQPLIVVCRAITKLIVAFCDITDVAVSIFLSHADHFDLSSISIFLSRTHVLYHMAWVLHFFVASMYLHRLANMHARGCVDVFFFVSIFLSQTDPPSASQKVSKQNRHAHFGLCFALCNSHSFLMLLRFVPLRSADQPLK